MNRLTENNIKKASLRYLKTYYKFRPRSGKTHVAYDQEAAGGIIADGYLTYPINEHNYFVATLEATSHDSRKEVVYEVQKKLLFWDSLAVSSLFTALFVSYGYANQFYSVNEIGLFKNVTLLVIMGLLVFAACWRILYNRHKYRYIYAIEQFKRYRVNEQWIAIAEDVFENPEEPALVELKMQCVNTGIGLISVDHDKDPHLLITPARQEVLSDNRKVLAFFNQLSDRIPVSDKSTIGKWVGNISNKIPTKAFNESLLRYQKAHINQMGLFALACLIIGFIYYKELKNDDIVYVKEEKYNQTLSEAKKKLTPEPKTYIVDTPSVTLPEGEGSYLDIAANQAEELVEEEAFQEKGGGEEYEIVESEILEMNATGHRPVVKNYMPSESNALLSYDCERFYNFQGILYMVQDNNFQSIESAQTRIKKLRSSGIECGLIWLGCFSKRETDYAIFYDLMYESKEEAISNLKAYKNILKKKKLKKGNLLIRSIRKVN